MARTLSYQVGILTLGRMFAFVVMFFIPIVNVRMLSKADFATYREYWLLFDTVSVVLIMGFPNSLLYYFPRSEHTGEKAVYLTQALTYLFGMGVVSWLIYWVLNATLGGALGAIVSQFFWALCLFTLLQMVSKVMETVFVADRHAERQAMYLAVSWTLQAVTIIAISVLTRRVDLIIYGLVAFSALKFVFTAVYCQGAYNLSWSAMTWRSFREQLSYTLPLGFASVILMLFARTDKYVIIHFMGQEAFAVYSVGAFQVPMVDILRNSIYNVAFPLMAEYQKDGRVADILALWRRATLKTAVLFFPIFVFLEFSAKPFITVLFTEEYVGAVPIFMIYMLIFLRSTIETGSVLLAFKRNAFLFKVNSFGFVIHIFFSVAMYKLFGWLAVPLATVTIVYVQNAANMLMACRLLQTPFYRVMPWGKLAVRLITAVAPGLGLVWLYRGYAVDDIVKLGLAGVGYFAVYFGLVLSLRFITLDEIRSIFGRT